MRLSEEKLQNKCWVQHRPDATVCMFGWMTLSNDANLPLSRHFHAKISAISSYTHLTFLNNLMYMILCEKIMVKKEKEKTKKKSIPSISMSTLLCFFIVIY